MGSRIEGDHERPRAVSEYLVERMIAAGATRLCFVISPGKTDILEYYGGRLWGADIAYVVQPAPGGLCDAVFRAIPFVRPDEEVLIGLPDTIWTPENGFTQLPPGRLAFLLFPSEHPEFFDAVVTQTDGSVQHIEVKQKNATSGWIWGAIRMPGTIFHALHQLWLRPERGDEYLGTLVNAYIAEGGQAVGVHAGEAYVDVGTLHGYRRAISLLVEESTPATPMTEEITTHARYATPLA
ncbi:Glucose-1-phosphate thymidylyltransferase [Granulicella sibirica]|uniref:glucose-1-phosphate thymidylyltransferase n=1 Tax=Granulicella sibirica TaxID=2479048 RepID=A0A4Q0SYB7_9BACT|nr:Glucose-1-phosphate thymidylyltransferase [Granulicella sibirica]